MSERLQEELELLKAAYPDLEHRSANGIDWVRLPSYPVPGQAFRQDSVEAVFQIPPQTGEAPYGFWLRPGLTLLSGNPVQNYTYPESTPWGGDFGKLSWAPAEPWIPKAEIRAGSNMLNWARSLADRLAEGI
ncbi:MAG: hypothetical protein ACJ77M_16695 [Thermoleophilaceae bacterium]